MPGVGRLSPSATRTSTNRLHDDRELDPDGAAPDGQAAGHEEPVTCPSRSPNSWWWSWLLFEGSDRSGAHPRCSPSEFRFNFDPRRVSPGHPGLSTDGAGQRADIQATSVHGQGVHHDGHLLTASNEPHTFCRTDHSIHCPSPSATPLPPMRPRHHLALTVTASSPPAPEEGLLHGTIPRLGIRAGATPPDQRHPDRLLPRRVPRRVPRADRTGPARPDQRVRPSTAESTDKRFTTPAPDPAVVS